MHLSMTCWMCSPGQYQKDPNTGFMLQIIWMSALKIPPSRAIPIFRSPEGSRLLVWMFLDNESNVFTYPWVHSALRGSVTRSVWFRACERVPNSLSPYRDASIRYPKFRVSFHWTIYSETWHWSDRLWWRHCISHGSWIEFRVINASLVFSSEN